MSVARHLLNFICPNGLFFSVPCARRSAFSRLCREAVQSLDAEVSIKFYCVGQLGLTDQAIAVESASAAREKHRVPSMRIATFSRASTLGFFVLTRAGLA